VRLKGKRVRTALFEVRHLASLLRHPRVGLVVPKHSHSAVERNLVKRRLRELLRLEFLPYLGSVDVVVRAAPAAYGASFDKLRDAALRARDAIMEHGAT
jgi:ribonuclease P protein component